MEAETDYLGSSLRWNLPEMHEVRGRLSRKRDFNDVEENGGPATIPVI